MSDSTLVSTRTLATGLTLVILAVAAGPTHALQSNNYVLHNVPAPGPVVVDGNLDDWDLSGEVWYYAETSLRNRYSLRGYAMWTSEALYLAGHWKDPTPMFNLINPNSRPGEGWKSDCWQIRMQTDEVLHLTCWYYTPRQEPVIGIDYADYGTHQQFAEPLLLRSTKGWKLTHGAEMAFRKDADGRGYVQEIKLPWKLLFKSPPPIEPGLSWRMGWEMLWGDLSGTQWPLHRYADLINPELQQREFFWSNKKAWGTALLESRGHLAVTTPVEKAQRIKRYAASQTDNHVLFSVPKPGPVKIDGDLHDWDLSGAIFVCRDVNLLRDKYSAEVYSMYDSEALYVATRVTDHTPMVNNYDPRFEQRTCFHSDCLFLRFNTDQIINLYAWYYTKGQHPAAVLMSGLTWWHNPQYISGDKVGITQAFRKDEAGKGYVQELRIPWSAIRRDKKAYSPGENLAANVDLVWGPANGKGWPEQAYLDLVEPGKSHTGWFWEVGELWGKIVLSPTGKLALSTPPWLRQVAVAAKPLEGPIVFRFAVPATARRFTVAIDQASGGRVRNLIADVDPADYAVSLTPDGNCIVELRWDCLDDEGQLVKPGRYLLQGLWHEGLHAYYLMSYYNPGHPPWDTADGTGNWGADHTNPRAVACANGRIFLGWPVAEGGWGIVALNLQGRKLWGFKRGWGGATCLAATAKYLYCGLDTGQIYRLSAASGDFAPFVRPDRTQLLDLFMHKEGAKGRLLDSFTGTMTDLAVYQDSLVASLREMNKLVLIDARTGVKKAELSVPRPTSLTIDAQGHLYVISRRDVVEVSLPAGRIRPIIPHSPGSRPTALATDTEGNLYVADTGWDMQVKVFSPEGKLLRRIGATGGRPAVGLFNPQGMRYMSSLDVDDQGHVWVVENDDRPRRVSVWGQDGKLIRDYIGNTNYAATGAFLDPRNPSRAFFQAMEFRLDYATQQYRLVRTLWRRQGPEAYFDSTGVGGALIWSSASSKLRQYIVYTGEARDYLISYTIVFQPAGDHWRPVAAIGRVSDRNQYVLGEQAGGTPFETHQRQAFCWVDRNGDGLAQADELNFTDKYGGGLGSGWTPQVGPDLSIYLSGSQGIYRFAPVAWSPAGAPCYDLDRGELIVKTLEGYQGEGSTILSLGKGSVLNSCALYPQAKGNRWAALRYKVVPDKATEARDAWWSYPNLYPGVHGSHRATMPAPGLLVGPLRISGIADMGPSVGKVVAMQGNLGQEFFITAEDGLYIGALFADCRLAPAPLPPVARAGMPTDDITLGGECFGGWLGRGPQGKVRLLAGGQDVRIYQISGLENVRRLPKQEITVTARQLQQAQQRLAQKKEKVVGPPQLEVRRIDHAPHLDGDLTDWPQLPAAAIKAGGESVAQVRLAYDDQNLYLSYQVTDSSPMLNSSKDWKVLFKTGDAVDLQLGTDPDAPVQRAAPVPGDLRVLISLFYGKPVAIVYRPVAPGTPEADKEHFISPVRQVIIDRVEIVKSALIGIRRGKSSYVVEAALPLKVLGLRPIAGLKLTGDLGVIFSDATGTVDLRRSYWANPYTVIVNDIPSEAELTPQYWGTFVFK